MSIQRFQGRIQRNVLISMALLNEYNFNNVDISVMSILVVVLCILHFEYNLSRQCHCKILHCKNVKYEHSGV